MLYDDYIKESLNETINIYGPDTVGRMEDFKTFLKMLLYYLLLKVIS